MKENYKIYVNKNLKSKDKYFMLRGKEGNCIESEKSLPVEYKIVGEFIKVRGRIELNNYKMEVRGERENNL